MVSLQAAVLSVWAQDIPVYQLESNVLPGMNTPRMSHVSFSTPDGDIVVVGGHTTSFSLTPTAERLHNGAWENIDIENAHDYAAVAMMPDGRVMLAGGTSGGGGYGYTHYCDIYDPSTNTFTTTGNMINQRSLCSAIATGVNNDIIVSGNWYANDESFDLWSNGSCTQFGSKSVQMHFPHMVSNNQGTVYVFGSHDIYGSLQATTLYKVNTIDKTVETVDDGLLSNYVINPASYGVPFASSVTSTGDYLFIGTQDGQYDLLAFNATTGTFRKLITITPPEYITTDGRDFILFTNVLVNNDRHEAYIAANIQKDKRCLIIFNYDIEANSLSAYYGDDIEDIPYWGCSWAINPTNQQIVMTGGTLIGSNFDANSFAISLSPFGGTMVLNPEASIGTIQNHLYDNGIWYTADGRRLNCKPEQKGVYIHNGSKVIIK